MTRDEAMSILEQVAAAHVGPLAAHRQIQEALGTIRRELNPPQRQEVDAVNGG